MRRIVYRIAALILVLSLFPCVSSCGEETTTVNNGYTFSDEELSECVTGLTTCLYGEYFFYAADGKMKYNLISDLQEVGMNIYSDTLAEGTDDPFGHVYFPIMLIDRAATNENGGSPVLIIAYENLRSDEGTAIVSYDLYKSEITVIKDGILSGVQYLCLYGDYIYYMTADYDEGNNIHRVKKDGSDYSTLDNPENNIYRLITAYEDRVYYYDSAGQIYSSTLDFQDSQHLVDDAGAYEPFVRDGYIYYYQFAGYVTLEATEENEERQIFSYDLYRCSTEDTSDSEVILEGITIAIAYCGDDEIYYYLANPYWHEDGSYDTGEDTLYAYSISTGETVTVYEGYDTSLSSRELKVSTDKYIIFEDYYRNGRGNVYVAHNISTGEETEIPY